MRNTRVGIWAENHALFTKNQILLLILGIISVQLMIQSVFHVAETNEANRVFKGLASLFRNEDIVSNPYSLSKEILDLAEKDVIRCPRLKVGNVNYLERLDLAPCSSSFWKLNGANIETSIESVNGQTWGLSVLVPNSVYFYVALWSFRILGIVSVLLLWCLKQILWLRVSRERELAKANLEYAGKIEAIAAQVAHDMASPLSAINIISLRAGLREDFSELLKSATARLNGIAADVLSFKNSTQNEDIGSVSLGETVAQIVAEKKMVTNVQIEFENGSDQFFAFANSNSIRRIISNLLNNAIESLVNGEGRVHIRISKVNTEYSRVDITDSGTGMSEDTLSKLGKRGYSFGKSGNGLGLSYAMATVERWGGRIEIASQVSKGTTVSIFLRNYTA